MVPTSYSGWLLAALVALILQGGTYGWRYGIGVVFTAVALRIAYRIGFEDGAKARSRELRIPDWEQ